MRSAVLDTNVYISAAIGMAVDRSSIAVRLIEDELFQRRNFESVTSIPILRELEDVLNRDRFSFSADFIVRFLGHVEMSSKIVPIHNVPMGCRDPRDDKIIETALNADADVIVSRDQDLSDPRAVYGIAKTGIGIRRRPIRVVGVSAFLAELRFGPRFSPLVLAVSA